MCSFWQTATLTDNFGCYALALKHFAYKKDISTSRECQSNVANMQCSETEQMAHESDCRRDPVT
jgi:hypothetical protein